VKFAHFATFKDEKKISRLKKYNVSKINLMSSNSLSLQTLVENSQMIQVENNVSSMYKISCLQPLKFFLLVSNCNCLLKLYALLITIARSKY